MRFDKSESGLWYIADWAGNRMTEGDFAARTWEDFESARAAVDVHINNRVERGELTEGEAEDEAGEYYAYPVDRMLERQRHDACQQYKLHRKLVRYGHRQEARCELDFH